MITCVITSADQTLTHTDIKSVTLPAVSGEMQVLSGHAELFALLEKGIISLEKSDGQKTTQNIDSGECYVKDDTVMIIL